ncbi:hypothetical protein HK100_005500 [Physocladia obscura]|uniref:Uncharacterized protein n=1 Tax=Physocladia obscura TaxID=109957 RepID=A0AAD5SRL7_9FUNG|nr:hypothetical protein HK100_005500 [Physocladia obscura]
MSLDKLYDLANNKGRDSPLQTPNISPHFTDAAVSSMSGQDQQSVSHQTQLQQQDYNFETFFGFVKDKADAVIIVEACVSGMLPCIPPNKFGNLCFRSDGGNWTTSKLNDGFLLYRETESSIGPLLNPAGTCPLFTAGSLKTNTQLVPDGMAKRTISLAGSDGNRYRVISYFYPREIEGYFNQSGIRILNSPSDLPEFASLKQSLTTQSTPIAIANRHATEACGIMLPPSWSNTQQKLSPSLQHEHNTVVAADRQCLQRCFCGGIASFRAIRHGHKWNETFFSKPLYLAPIRKIPSVYSNYQ